MSENEIERVDKEEKKRLKKFRRRQKAIDNVPARAIASEPNQETRANDDDFECFPTGTHFTVYWLLTLDENGHPDGRSWFTIDQTEAHETQWVFDKHGVEHVLIKGFIKLPDIPTQYPLDRMVFMSSGAPAPTHLDRTFRKRCLQADDCAGE